MTLCSDLFRVRVRVRVGVRRLRQRCILQSPVLLVLGLDVDDDWVHSLLQQALHIGQAELQQTVLILREERWGKRGKEIKIKKSLSCYLSSTSYLILMWKPEEKCTLKTDTLEILLLLKNLYSGGTFTLKYRCPGSGGTLRLEDQYPGGTLTLKYRYPGSGATLTLKYRYPGGNLTMKYSSRRWFTWLTMSCMDCSLMPRESSGIEGFSINTCFWHLSVAGMGSAAHKGKECIHPWIPVWEAWEEPLDIFYSFEKLLKSY